MPYRPRNGTQEIMRMMFEVRKGIVQIKNKTNCQMNERTWKARKYATVKPMVRVKNQVIPAYLKVLT